MKIQIHETNLAITAAERSYVEDRLALALARYGARIAKVVVSLSGAEAAGERSDKRCQIDVDIRPETVHVEDEDTNLLTALDRATGRLARTVARALEHDRT